MRYLILILILTSVTTTLFGQFVGQSIFFTSPEVGFISGIDWNGSHRTIAKTTTGGIVWSFLSEVENKLCYDLFFTDSMTGYGVGEDIENGGGVIMKTTNGGVDWTSQINGSSSYFKSIFFTDMDVGYACGFDFFEDYRLIKTTDGGTTWFDQTCGTNKRLNSIFFPDQLTGYVVGNGGVIFKTSNGGDSWNNQQSGTVEKLNDIYFTDSSKGFCIGDNGIIITTSNGGSSWIGYSSNISVSLNAIYFIDNNKGIIVGDEGVILITSNGGEEWISQPSGTNQDLISVYFPDEYIGYIGCKSEKYLKTTDGGYNWAIKQIKTVKLLSPNGGEVWYSTEVYQLIWDAYMINNIKLELSTNNGQEWSVIIDSMQASQFFEWIPSNTDSLNECLMKISDLSDSNVFDISDQTFSLLPTNIFVESPNGGEVWTIGSTKEIKWLSVGNFERVSIRLSLNNGEDWSIIAISIPDQGSYLWNVDATEESNECLIKITPIGAGGLFDVSDEVFTIQYPNEVQDDSELMLAKKYILDQNFPNPFNPSTIISYNIPELSIVSLKVYDVTGNEVATLVNKEIEPGNYNILFNATNLASGIYLYRLQAGSFVQTKKMLLLK